MFKNIGFSRNGAPTEKATFLWKSLGSSIFNGFLCTFLWKCTSNKFAMIFEPIEIAFQVKKPQQKQIFPEWKHIWHCINLLNSQIFLIKLPTFSKTWHYKIAKMDKLRKLNNWKTVLIINPKSNKLCFYRIILFGLLLNII